MNVAFVKKILLLLYLIPVVSLYAVPSDDNGLVAREDRGGANRGGGKEEFNRGDEGREEFNRGEGFKGGYNRGEENRGEFNRSEDFNRGGYYYHGNEGWGGSGANINVEGGGYANPEVVPVPEYQYPYTYPYQQPYQQQY